MKRLPSIVAGLACSMASALSSAAMPALGQYSQDALRTVGPNATHILDLWRLTLAICTGVFVAVVAVLLAALWRSRQAAAQALQQTQPLPERSLHWRIGAGTAVSTVLLLVLLGASIVTDRALGVLAKPQDAVQVEVVGHQWWWELRYQEADVSRRFATANELHVPVGRPVQLTLKADDVIHSFWVPNIAGKKDLIPGRTTTLTIQADRAGSYRGQCAEFCGAQHAWMAFLVVADEPAQYEAWADAQRRAAQPPASAQAQRGQQVFMQSTCVMCHAIQGTDANAQRAPDLTHVGSRQTLAAGRLNMNREMLASWIADPQRHKPGVNMPGHRFDDADLQALAAYLEGLK
jgi:cytochrome c oxidase subunit 2